MTDAASYSTAAGEHLVLGQLLRLGVSAYLAQGPTQKGWDIIFKLGSDLKTVQVKTIGWPKEKAVNGSLTAGFDFLIVVLLDRDGPHPRYLILAAADVEQYLSRENPERKVKGRRTLTVSNHKLETGGTLQKHENNWSILCS
ncbi:hypothetical protein [Polaromonas sp. YR568]|uniref:hypothetical protein n=1 Tax=Polaromonas sp. YR568 TaxID=1855301 RepID=UPI00398C0288